ncbi:MAG: hypothetical protein M5U16_09390 [Hyphomicrobium sp.]|nr:hypothetical protein [Hyphomicrobium sp.]
MAVEARQAYNRAERRFLQSQEELQAWVLPPPHAAHEALFGMWKNQPEVRQKLRDAMEEVIRQGRTALEKLQAIIRDYPETDHAVTLIGGGEVAGLSIASLEEGLSEHEAQRKLVLEEMQRLDQGAAPRSQDAAKQGAPSAAATEDLQALDGKLQKMLNWRVVKREFPDWYSERLNEAARLSANNQPKLAITKHLAEALVGLRRQHANAALAASTERLKDVASAFLNNLKSLSARSVASCHGFISQGETAPAVLELLLSPEQGASLHVQLAATFEAIADGRKASVMRTRATNADYDLLRQELTKLGWKQADFQIFSEPSALAGQQPDRICSMMQDWIAAHLSVEDGAVQERLLVEVLKPLVSG